MSQNRIWKDVKEYFSYLDLFGQKIDLTYRKNIYFRTFYGALFTLIIFVIIIIHMIEGYKDLTSRSNPIINVMEVEDVNTMYANLTKSNVSLALAFVSDNKKEFIYDPSLFDVEINYISKLRNITSNNNTLSNNVLSLEKCGDVKNAVSNFKKTTQIKKYYDNFELKNAMCITNKNKSIAINSNRDDFIENYLKINIKFCKNSTMKISPCKPYEEILNTFLKLNIYLYITHQYFDGKDIKQPIKERLTFEKWSFENLDSKQRDMLYLTPSSLTDYNNLFLSLSDPKPIDFIYYSERDLVKSNQNVKFLKNEDIKFLEIYIRSHTNTMKIYRKYNTFIDLLGNIGGLFNVFLFWVQSFLDL